MNRRRTLNKYFLVFDKLGGNNVVLRYSGIVLIVRWDLEVSSWPSELSVFVLDGYRKHSVQFYHPLAVHLAPWIVNKKK